ncbi:MAG: hypothetical protein MZV65_32825, partial [Chromatiales bacterium]|nr:hypothetical protein [Chromatiales bacterium]
MSNYFHERHRQLGHVHDLERGRAEEHALHLTEPARAHHDAAAAVVSGRSDDRLRRLAEHDEELVGAAGLVEHLPRLGRLRLPLLLQALTRAFTGQAEVLEELLMLLVLTLAIRNRQ